MGTRFDWPTNIIASNKINLGKGEPNVVTTMVPIQGRSRALGRFTFYLCSRGKALATKLY